MTAMIMHHTISVILNLMKPHKQNQFRTVPYFFFSHLKIIFKPVKFHVWENQRAVITLRAVKPASPRCGTGAELDLERPQPRLPQLPKGWETALPGNPKPAPAPRRRWEMQQPCDRRVKTGKKGQPKLLKLFFKHLRCLRSVGYQPGFWMLRWPTQRGRSVASASSTQLEPFWLRCTGLRAFFPLYQLSSIFFLPTGPQLPTSSKPVGPG